MWQMKSSLPLIVAHDFESNCARSRAASINCQLVELLPNRFPDMTHVLDMDYHAQSRTFLSNLQSDQGLSTLLWNEHPVRQSSRSVDTVLLMSPETCALQVQNSPEVMQLRPDGQLHLIWHTRRPSAAETASSVSGDSIGPTMAALSPNILLWKDSVFDGGHLHLGDLRVKPKIFVVDPPSRSHQSGSYHSALAVTTHGSGHVVFCGSNDADLSILQFDLRNTTIPVNSLGLNRDSLSLGRANYGIDIGSIEETVKPPFNKLQPSNDSQAVYLSSLCAEYEKLFVITSQTFVCLNFAREANEESLPVSVTRLGRDEFFDTEGHDGIWAN